jgi:hypothetical protein
MKQFPEVPSNAKARGLLAKTQATDFTDNTDKQQMQQFKFCIIRVIR